MSDEVENVEEEVGQDALEFLTALSVDIPNPDTYDSMSLAQLGKILKDLKTKLELAGSIKTQFQKAYDHLSMVVIPERMDEEGIVNIKIDGVGRLQCSSDIRCNVLAANREALEQWLIENGHAALVQTTVNSSSLKAFIKERMKENLPCPEMVKVEPYSRATVVKA